MAEKKVAKVVDFEPLGALLGPGTPDPELLRFGTDSSKLKHKVRKSLRT